MNKAFIVGFLDELEKQAFFGKKELGQLQAKLKKLQHDLSKQPQIETVPAGGGTMVEKPVRPGSVMESAKSMAGDIVRKVKTLRPMKRRTAVARQDKPRLAERVKGWFGKHK